MISTSFRLIATATVSIAIVFLAGCERSSARDIRKAKEAVRAEMYDPDAAKFRNVFKLSDDEVCGEVNGKNRYGAYIGFAAFSYYDYSHTEDGKVTYENQYNDYSNAKDKYIGNARMSEVNNLLLSNVNCPAVAEPHAYAGYSNAQYNLGKLYESGNGVEKDIAKAIRWYLAATKQDEWGAKLRLSRLSREYCYGVDSDIAVAKDLLKGTEWEPDCKPVDSHE